MSEYELKEELIQEEYNFKILLMNASEIRLMEQKETTNCLKVETIEKETKRQKNG